VKTNIIAPFNPLPWQIKPFRDKSKIMLLTGSAGGGKSRIAGEKIHAYCKHYSGAMALMVRKKRSSMTNSTVLFMDRTVIGKDSTVTHFPSKHRFEYANGSILAYGGMANEEQREQVRSIGQEGGLDIFWMEEANRFLKDDYQELLVRLRGKAGGWRQGILTTNSDASTHFIKRELIDSGVASVYYSNAGNNPHNPDGYQELLDSLTGVLGKRLAKGLWVQAEGVVYDNFSDELHVIDKFDIPSEWTRFRVIDFGYTNPFVCQWWALDHDGRMHLYREIYMAQRLVEDHAKQINELSQGEHISFTVADHDAEDRATLERYGIYTTPAKKSISTGLAAVASRLRKAGDGRPRLFIMKDTLVETDLSLGNLPQCTLDEFPVYIWPEGKDGKPLKEVPVDMYNHGMDCLRYGVMELEHEGSLMLW
jgi:PBSX family phage terminase large subunit